MGKINIFKDKRCWWKWCNFSFWYCAFILEISAIKNVNILKIFERTWHKNIFPHSERKFVVGPMPSSLRAAGIILSRRINVECPLSFTILSFAPRITLPPRIRTARDEEKHHSLTERAPVSERRSLYIFFLIRSQEDRSEALLRQDQWTELDGRGTLTSQERKKMH